MRHPDAMSAPPSGAPAAPSSGFPETPTQSLPPPLAAAAAAPGSDLAWRVVGLANLYRLLLPPVLYGLQLVTRPTPTVGASDPRLFVFVCIVYWVLGGFMAFGGKGRWRSRRALVFVNTALDTTAICTLLYCSGGVSSGLGILLVIPVGAMSLLAEGRASLAVAALAALGLLTQQILAVIAGNAQTYDYSLAGMLGAVVFLVALMAWPVSNRLRESEALVRRQEFDLAIWRSSRNTSCNACARASWSWTRRTVSDSSTSRPLGCSATISRCPGLCWERSRRDCCICCPPGDRTGA